jgi:TPP-dependent pyruvate/acetoin dehydrogenase alpha subunit
VFVCENNGYAEFTASAGFWGGPAPVDRAASYGLAARFVDGSDVARVEDAMRTAAEAVRAGEGPAFLEMRTHRLGGHYEGDAQEYRDERELERWRGEHDPLARLQAVLDERGDGEAARVVVRSAEAEMDAAVERALMAPFPEPSTVLDYVGV